MDRTRRIVQRIFSGCVVGMGMMLSACQSTEAGAVMAIEEEGGPTRTIVKKMIGGVVMNVVRHKEPRRVSLVIRETYLTSSGRPECRKFTGRLLTIGNVQMLFKEDPGRLKSAMVVMGSPKPSSLSALVPGDCVSVAPDDIDRPSSFLTASIEIDSSPTVAKNSDHLGKGIVELWAASPFRPPVTLGLKKVTGMGRRVVTSIKPKIRAPISRSFHPA